MHEALNHAKLAMLFRKEFELCNVRKGETVVLLSDLGARRDYVAAAFAAAEEFGADAYEMCVNAMPSWTKVGVETVGRCKGTLEAIKSADMLVCLHIPLFTRWLKEAREAGTRVLMVIDGPDELETLMAPPGLKEAVGYAGERLQRTKTMRITRAGGTDLTVKLGEYPTMIQYGYAETPGRFDHWGAGDPLPAAISRRQGADFPQQRPRPRGASALAGQGQAQGAPRHLEGGGGVTAIVKAPIRPHAV